MATGAEWAGRLGQEWVKRARDFDRLLAPPGIAGLEMLGDVAGLSVLDVGCGGGTSSRDLAGRGARVTGVDVSPDLVAVARERGGGPEYLCADASRDPLGGPFDGLFSRFGAMFFDDAVGGWAHVRSAMRPGAKAVIVAWQSQADNQWVDVPARLADPLVRADLIAEPPRGSPGPFAWGDAEFAVGLLRDAGWRDIAVTPWNGMLDIATDDHPDPAVRGAEAILKISPLGGRLKESSDAEIAAVREALISGLAEHVEGDVVRLACAVWLIGMRA